MKKNTILLLSILAIMLSISSAGWIGATFGSASDCGPWLLPFASIDFYNDSDKEIYVAMDDVLERHSIGPGSQTTFRKARIGDRPTFHIFYKKGGPMLYTRPVNICTGSHSYYKWDGEKILNENL